MESPRAERPPSHRGKLWKRGPSGQWNKRWVVLDENKLFFYKDKNDREFVSSVDLSSATQINKLPEVFPKSGRDTAFSVDVRDGKEIKTFYYAAKGVEEKEGWIVAIATWRKYLNQLKKAEGKKEQLEEALKTIEALKEQTFVLKKQLQVREDPVAKTDEVKDLRAQVDLLQEQLEELRSKNRRLEDQLEEERFMSSDLKKQFLEQRRKLQMLVGEDDV